MFLKKICTIWLDYLFLGLTKLIFDCHLYVYFILKHYHSLQRYDIKAKQHFVPQVFIVYQFFPGTFIFHCVRESIKVLKNAIA